MALVTWERYSSLYKTIEKTEFDRLEALAEMEVKQVIGAIHWSEILEDISAGVLTPEDPRYDVLLDCICRVMEYQETTGKTAGTGLTSVTNDGYTESYAADTQTASAAGEELAKNIRMWLSGAGFVRAY